MTEPSLGVATAIHGRRLIPSLTALQCFDAAARYLSFTRAAVELCVTQSAISRQIRQLEDQIGQPLFHRSTNRLILTQTGAEYAAAVRGVLKHVEDATLQLMAAGSGRPKLTLALLPTFGSRWLVPRLGSFVARHPLVQLSLTTYLSPFAFEGSEADAAIHFGTDAWSGAVCHRLMGEVLVPVCARTLLANCNTLSNPEAILKLPLLQHTTRPLAWLEWCSQAGLPTGSSLSGIKFDYFYMMIQAAIAGLGVALLPRFLVQDELDSGRLVVASNLASSSDLAYWLVYPEEKAHLPMVVGFREWLLNERAPDSEPSAPSPPAR